MKVHHSCRDLRQYPFGRIKIDRSFLVSIEDAATMEILHAIVSLGRGLGMTVTAEGVETPEQLAILRRKGCEQVQGYLLGKPQPLTELVGRLVIGDDERLTVKA